MAGISGHVAIKARFTYVGAVIRAVHVGSHNFAVVRNVTIEEISLRPGYTSVCNENVEPAVELVYDLVNQPLNLLLVCHIDLICSACEVSQIQQRSCRMDSTPTFNTVYILNLLRSVDGFPVAMVPYSNI